MTPYFETENGVLYCGDAAEILPEIETNQAAFLTDPPYGLDQKWTGGTWFKRGVYRDGVPWDKKTESVVKVLKEIGRHKWTAIVWGGLHYSMPPTRCHLAWVKTNSVPTMADFELAWTNLDKPSKKYLSPCNGWKRIHPTEKPKGLIQWCLGFISEEMVVDPFFGSGTTGAVCERLGLRWVGIEESEEWCEKSAKRIIAETQQLRLFA